MSIDEPASVAPYRAILDHYLLQLSKSRHQGSIPPPVEDTECSALISEVQALHDEKKDPAEAGASGFAILETVFRDIFVKTVSSIPINDPGFSRIWVLLDVVTLLSDHSLCEATLSFWLVEDLLDSQTIEGCRKVFDFLESRRERMIKDGFKSKHLTVLRCCNELLRRLSRAEDTVFCGRVFIFMFQSFPLGDRSSVNLRGEFHVENITTFDPVPQRSEDAIKPMEIDSQTVQAAGSGSATPSSSAVDTERPSTAGRLTPASRKEPKVEEKIDLDALYPKFWNLQSLFSNPVDLFKAENMSTFKDGITATMTCFQSMNTSTSTISPTNLSEDTVKRGIKRKRTEPPSESVSSSNFNPKYLTNRDLFDLELQDIAFRRHILVQTLIMLDFLQSLTATAKTKLTSSGTVHNNSVLYDYTLSPDDTKWCLATRAKIAEYLQAGSGTEGKSYYRMVDTVLSRDKNWVRWKAESCANISREAVPPAEILAARATLEKQVNLANRPLIAPAGASDLEFLNKSRRMEDLIVSGQEKRAQIPSMAEFYKGIQADLLDAEMGTEEEVAEARERASGKLWRALRASGRRFELCERIECGRNLGALVDEGGKPEEMMLEAVNGEVEERDKEGTGVEGGGDGDGDEAVRIKSTGSDGAQDEEDEEEGEGDPMKVEETPVQEAPKFENSDHEGVDDGGDDNDQDNEVEEEGEEDDSSAEPDGSNAEDSDAEEVDEIEIDPQVEGEASPDS